jgi:hypothetical protein
MKYLLAVGFFCKVYRKEPQARIFVNDQLIDEFFIQHDIEGFDEKLKRLKRSNNHILQPIDRSLELKPKSKPKFIKIYEIEINKNLQKLKINIDIKNDDNNYTNGFMTKSTLIKFEILQLIPLHEGLIKLFKDKGACLLKKNYPWYHRNFNDWFNILSAGFWQEKNSTLRQEDFWYFIGGSGNFLVELIKKYKIFMNKKNFSYRSSFDSNTIDFILDKYKQHANQRNNN